MAVLALALAASLAMAHLFAGRLHFLHGARRSRWLSFAGGISVAYIFVHLLPELAQGQQTLEEAEMPRLAAIESHVWLVALFGLVVFYGIERAAKCSRKNDEAGAGGAGGGSKVFWLHIGSFACYNVLIGYLLVHRTDDRIADTIAFWFAMLLHFVVNDFSLHNHHPQKYAHRGRWVLALGVMAGCLLGLAVQMEEAAVVVLIAFIGGGVVLNVMKEELPEERDSSFVSFAVGATIYSTVLLAL